MECACTACQEEHQQFQVCRFLAAKHGLPRTLALKKTTVCVETTYLLLNAGVVYQILSRPH
jgi:hypothetical protein